jgi:lipoprotein-anchoring transpeptidase ErfK/SrfK
MSTPVGEFKIYRKVRSQVMSGPGYHLPNVEYVSYFAGGNAIHGTYWHNNFGHPMSHGCVNMRNDDARWIYRWAPVGTPVRVQR